MSCRAVTAVLLALIYGCDAGVETTPVPTARIFIADDGVTLAYDVTGSGEPALVFLHGWCCDRTHWDAQVGPFSRRHRVVRLDFAGHGESGADREEWTLARLGRDVAALVEHLELEEVVLVGHSMGGYVALEAARLLPGRVRGIVGVDTLHDAEFEYVPEDWRPRFDSLREDFSRGCDAFVRALFLPDADRALVDRVAGSMCDADPAVAMPLFEDLFGLDFKEAFRGAGVPIRVIVSGVDPVNVEGNRRYVPSFDAVTMDGVGHFPMLERPAEFNRRLGEAIGSGGPEPG